MVPLAGGEKNAVVLKVYNLGLTQTPIYLACHLTQPTKFYIDIYKTKYARLHCLATDFMASTVHHSCSKVTDHHSLSGLIA